MSSCQILQQHKRAKPSINNLSNNHCCKQNGVLTSIHCQQIGVRPQLQLAVPLVSHTACYFEISHTLFHHFYIIHRGLILHRPLGPSAPKINTNDWLRIGSTFHSLHAIAAEASPVKLPGNKNPGEKSLCVVL